MASFCSFLATFMVFMVCFSYTSLALTSQQVLLQYSTISAAPAFLPEAPLSSSTSSSPPTQSLSPDIEPVLPTTRAAVPSPAESSSLPTIPASPSPPNPDVIDPAPGPVFGISPSGSLPASSATSSSTLYLTLHFLGFLLFCLMQLSAV